MKEKMVKDPGYEARLRKLGPQPTADSPLSGERLVMVDEVHHTVTESGVDDAGILRVRVTPQRMPDGGGQPQSHIPSPMDYVRRRSAEHEELMAEAANQVVPAIEYRKPMLSYAKFVTRDGHGAWVGTVCWCLKEGCVSFVDGACTEGHRQVVQNFVRRVQPATMDAYLKMVSEEGASQAGDTAARVAAASAEIANKAVAEKKAAEAEQHERDVEILELRRQERTRPRIEPMSPEAAAARRQAEWNSARMR